MMKQMIAAVALALLGCAPKAPVDLPVAPNNFDGVMDLVGRFSYAHACPCDELILTAAHVAHPLFLVPGHKDDAVAYAWSDGRGGEGYILSDYLYLSRDLGVMRIQSGMPAYYRHSQSAPQIGDVLHWIEYDLSSVEKAFARVHRQGTILRIFAGHIVLDHMPIPGASGTCVFNSDNEIVAIVSWRHRVGVAVVVSVYGQWWPGG